MYTIIISFQWFHLWMFYLVFEFRHSVSYCFIVFTANFHYTIPFLFLYHTNTLSQTHTHTYKNLYVFHSVQMKKIPVKSIVVFIQQCDYFDNKHLPTNPYAKTQRNTHIHKTLLLIYFSLHEFTFIIYNFRIFIRFYFFFNLRPFLCKHISPYNFSLSFC